VLYQRHGLAQGCFGLPGPPVSGEEDALAGQVEKQCVEVFGSFGRLGEQLGQDGNCPLLVGQRRAGQPKTVLLFRRLKVASGRLEPPLGIGNQLPGERLLQRDRELGILAACCSHASRSKDPSRKKVIMSPTFSYAEK